MLGYAWIPDLKEPWTVFLESESLIFFFYSSLRYEILSGVRGGGLASVLDVQPYFFILENWICTMTRHHGNNILLARNLSFGSDVRQWSYPLMMPLYCLWAKSNNRICGQFGYDDFFSFVHMARCGCCSIVCLCF